MWRVAFFIGALRIGALWLGATGLRGSGWPQVLGYFLLMLTLPDIYLAKFARSQPLEWAAIGSAILAVTSLMWAALLVRVVAQLRRRAGGS
jgi:hypothetical protein